MPSTPIALTSPGPDAQEAQFISDKIDVDMTKLVFDTLHNKNRSTVLYAMNIFDLIKSDKLSPELKRIISSKCDEIRACSMDSLLELDGEALLPEMDDAIEEEHIDTQIKDIMSLDVYQELMKKEIGKIVQKENKESVDLNTKVEKRKTTTKKTK